MNYEEARKLKKGTPILIRTKAVSVDIAGDIVYETRARDQEYEVMYAKTGYQHADIQTQEQALEEDIPVRLFKKGDKVRSKKLRGRYYSPAAQRYADHILTVASDEVTDSRDGEVWVTYEDDNDECTWNVDPVYLELVTPVAETSPYYMVEKDVEFQVRMKVEDKDCLISAFRFKNIVEGYTQYYDMLPSMKQAREAAEAELNRLNEEYSNREK